MKNVKEVLINKNASIRKAMEVIRKVGIKMAIVVDANNKLVGVVTDGDIRRGLLDGAKLSDCISEIMNKNPLYAKPHMSRDEILGVFKIRKSVIGIPIINDDKIVEDLVVLSEGTTFAHYNSRPNLKKKVKRILVIGGAGFIGSILVRMLLENKYKVTVLDKFIYNKESLDHVKSNPDLRIIAGDTRHIEDLTNAMYDADAVVHLAELVGDPACELDTAKTHEINYLATRTIAELCKHFEITRLIYASSCSVYGASKGDKLLCETSPIRPVSLYAKMKVASENTLGRLQDNNFQPTILRFATVFGASHRLRFDLVVNLLTAKAIKDKKIIVFNGNQWRPNVHVTDVCKTIISVLEAPIEKVGGQIFNVGSEENNYTINQIGKIIKEELPDAELIIEDRDIDIRDYKVDFKKLKSVFNLKMKDLTYGINEIKEIFKNIDLNYTDKKYSNIKFLSDNIIECI